MFENKTRAAQILKHIFIFLIYTIGKLLLLLPAGATIERHRQ